VRGTAQTAQLWTMGIILGLVDIPRMCLLYMSFAGGRTFGHCKPGEKKQILAITTSLTVYSSEAYFFLKL